MDSTAYPSEMGKIVEQDNDGVRAGLGNKHANTRDVPRFGALLWRKHPYVPPCCSLLINHKDSGYNCSLSCIVKLPAALVSQLEEEEGGDLSVCV